MRKLLAAGIVLMPLLSSPAAPVVSGPQPGQKPGPYTAIVSVGPQRGQLHCFICETADKPAVIVFARGLSDPLGKVLREIEKALGENKAADPRTWVTFLSDDQPGLDPKVIRWAQEQAIRNVPLGVFEDLQGPPVYRLNKEADVTLLLAEKQKVVRNFAFRAGELTDARVQEVVKAIQGFLKGARK